jgi:hypothetical protein
MHAQLAVPHDMVLTPVLPVVHADSQSVNIWSLLGQADSFALKVRSLLLPGVQDPSNQCLLHLN